MLLILVWQNVSRLVSGHIPSVELCNILVRQVFLCTSLFWTFFHVVIWYMDNDFTWFPRLLESPGILFCKISRSEKSWRILLGSWKVPEFVFGKTVGTLSLETLCTIYTSNNEMETMMMTA